MARALLDELAPPQRLALAYAPRRARAATLALLALDARLAAILRRRGEPVLVQLRLAWWRDMLAKEPQAWPRGDAVLDLLREWRGPAALAALVDGWEALLADELAASEIDAFASGRGSAFAQLAFELGCAPEIAEAGGRRWALADLAANLADPAERAAAVASAVALPPRPRLPRELRPLAILDALAARSLARGGAPLLDGFGAGLLAVRLGITGR